MKNPRPVAFYARQVEQIAATRCAVTADLDMPTSSTPTTHGFLSPGRMATAPLRRGQYASDQPLVLEPNRIPPIDTSDQMLALRLWERVCSATRAPGMDESEHDHPFGRHARSGLDSAAIPDVALALCGEAVAQTKIGPIGADLRTV